MKKIVLDAGHGGPDLGATFHGSQEKTFNLAIALNVQHILSQNYQVEIMMTRNSDVALPLDARTNLANLNNADLFLSIHNNAAGGSGFETYIYNGALCPTTQTYQDTIHDSAYREIGSTYKVRNRGKKRADFHVLRETDRSALLIEVLFIDNADDLALLRNPAFINDVSRGIAEGVADALHLPRIPTPPTSPGTGLLYRVIAGEFQNRESAEQRVKTLAEQGFSGFISQVDIAGVTYFRVQTGAFKEKENAEEQVERLTQHGIPGASIRGTGEFTPTDPAGNSYTLLGEMYLNACQLDAYVKTVNPDAPDLGCFYSQYGEAYGIRGDVAYAQAINETNYFRFTGLVDPDQNNFAGIGATGPGNHGATFDTPEEGVHAHIQHLYAYASTKPIPSGLEKVDPRFDLVTRGIAPTWIGLNGRWAVPGNTYGQLILEIYERNITHALEALEEQRTLLNSILEKS